MKRHSILTKLVSAFLSILIVFALVPQQVQAVCYKTTTVPPVAPADCSCSGVAWSSGSCGGPYIDPLGSYYRCDPLPEGVSGKPGCTSPLQKAYYLTGSCTPDTSYLAVLACAIAAIFATSACATGIVAGCFIGGVFFFGIPCFVAIAACAAEDLLALYACSYCQTHSCPNPSGSQVTPKYVQENQATGTAACPPDEE